MRLYTPTTMTLGDWNHLCRKTGLQREDWGDAWLALAEEHRGRGGEPIPEDVCLAIVTRVHSEGFTAEQAVKKNSQTLQPLAA